MSIKPGDTIWFIASKVFFASGISSPK
ncbi:hypothetical protein [Emergencia sp. 1XD21-10]